MGAALEIYDQRALLERLTDGVTDGSRPIAFLVGAPLTSPTEVGGPGVPSVSDLIQLVRAEFTGSKEREFDKALLGAANPYQAAFSYLIGRRGQDAANTIIKRAVWGARTQSSRRSYTPDARTADDVCKGLDADISGWHFSPAVRALGELCARQPKNFSGPILTTNFDPLIEAAVKAAGGNSFRTVLHGDGNLSQTEATGSHVIHLHGYWYGSDTLHTPRQLGQERPQLKNSLRHLLHNHTLVVIAYGGWDDVFTRTLMEVVLDDQSYPEVIWASYSQNPTTDDRLFQGLAPGIDRARVTIYGGVDCHSFLPDLQKAWNQKAPADLPDVQPRTTALLALKAATYANTQSGGARGPGKGKRRISIEQDHPPIVDFYVGREADLERLSRSDAAVEFITGIGGQGKSALAAKLFSDQTTVDKYELRVWRDCKEESERFESQLAIITEALTEGAVSATELAQQSTADIVTAFEQASRDKSIILVFDNVDHYVDLDANALTGAPRRLVDAVAGKLSNRRIVFTCRPDIQPWLGGMSSSKIEGLSLNAARDLFRLREAHAEDSAIRRAHEHTRGHAFWLNLIAAQLAKGISDDDLNNLIESLAIGESEIPIQAFHSVWNGLKEREQLVLRALAETVRSTTEVQLADYLSSKIRYNQISKALKSLRSLNLIVYKPRGGGLNIIELHPLVRAFVRSHFSKNDRVSYIDAILAVYLAFIGQHKTKLSNRSPYQILAHWIEGAELYIEAGNYDAAMEQLFDVRVAISGSDQPGEYIRVCSDLFNRMDWSEGAKNERFEYVFETYFEMLVVGGRHADAVEMLENYKETLEGKDARYIQYCNLNSYLHWLNGNFPEAMKWAGEGVELKSKSNVDTRFDAAHNLALSQRDAGLFDPALEYFLKEKSLDEVIDPAEFEITRGGSYYGNIGRCLHLMGQLEPALICYKKSAIALEKQADNDHTANQAYIRQWLGELLISSAEAGLAQIFWTASLAKWDLISPPRAAALRAQMAVAGVDDQETDPEEAERSYAAWLATE